MIPIGSPALYATALSALSQHKLKLGNRLKGRFVQVFLGLKFFQNNIPSMYSGSFIATELLQSLMDDLYAKASRPANHCVLSLFESNYLARTGLIGPANSTAQNTWRNNFNLQKGVGCYALPADLSSMAFLDQPRRQCVYLQPSLPGTLAGGKCSLCVTGATYRNEEHRKWLRIDPGGGGYACTDIQNVPNFAPEIAPGGQRIPLAPLVVAIYHDADPGLVLGNRPAVSINEFAADFNFSAAELSAYFDSSMTHPLNASLAASKSWPTGASLGILGGSAAPVAVGGPALLPPAAVPAAGGLQPVLGGTPAPPPMTNSGWDAEQYVAAALAQAGWTPHVVSRQQLGYDIFAQRGHQRRYVEVKSSVGLCSPSLTAREWQQATHYKGDYVLAVLENFNPVGLNNIHWIPDPATRCVSTRQVSISHGIARTSWAIATVTVGNI